MLKKKPAAKPATKAAPQKPAAKAKAADPEEETDFGTAPIEVWMPSNSGGRPKADIDPHLVEEMAAIGCTVQEIAAVCRVCPRTLFRRQEDDDAFRDVLDRGRNSGKATLRRMLWVSATRGNIAAQIFLAKQKEFLGFTDKPVEPQGPAGGTLPPINIQVVFVKPGDSPQVQGTNE